MDTHIASTLSINERMRRLSKRTVWALFITLGMMAFASYHIASSMHDSLHLRDQLELIKSAQFKIVQINLAAMDIIVDRTDGKVAPEREEELDDGLNFLTDKVVPALPSIYEELGQSNKKKEIADALELLRSKTKDELITAVNGRAADDVFAALDDVIDETGGGISDDLGKLSSAMENNLQTSLGSSRTSSMAMVVGNIFLFISISIGSYFLIGYIQKTVIAPMEKITNDTIQAISNSAQGLNETTHHLDTLMTSAATETKEGSHKASLITGSVEGVAAAVEELASSIGEIRRQATISTEVSELAVKEAYSMSDTIRNLNVATQGIGEITELINKIAEGTNLLALNATIEAARAGEAGKGFAVVATEVKNLAVKTAEATDDISRKVQEMQDMSTKAVAAIGNIQETISEINNANSNVMNSVEQQSIATTEITRTLTEATIGLRGTSDMIENINQTIQSTKEDSQLVFTSAKNLLDVSENAQLRTRQLIDGTA